MKTSLASFLGVFVVVGYGATLSLGGCAATAKSGFDDDAGTGDDGGVTHPDSGKKDSGGTTGQDSGGGGQDSGGGGQDSGGGGQDSGGGSGTQTCQQIIQCANACTTNACAQACVMAGTPAAQGAFNGLLDCLFGMNGMSGACGAQCGTQSTACTNCLNAAQMSGGACYTQVQTCAAN